MAKTLSAALAACLLLTAALPQPAAAAVSLKIHATQPGVAEPVCVRAIIRKSDGSYVAGEWGNPAWPPITMRGKAMAPDTEVQVPVGSTQITIGKGPDYKPIIITTNLATDGRTYTINVTLQPALDLYNKGWRGGDAHVHYIHGEDQVRRTPEEAFRICAAGGMNFTSFCEEHYGVTQQTGQQMMDNWKAFDNSECKLWMGVEEPKNAWGHHVAILYDPWEIRSAVPYHWGIDTVHKQGGVSYPVHPQRFYPSRYYDDPAGNRQWFFVPMNNHAKAFPLDALIGHLYDGWSGQSDDGSHASMLEPYFKLLQMGYRIPFLTDSDMCLDKLNNGEKASGGWMTYYHMGGQPVTRAALAETMRRGRITCTTGPLVLFTIDNAMPGDTLPADGRTRTVRIEASHTFNPWTLANATISGSDICRVQQIDLFRNGQVIRTWNPNTPTTTVQHTITETSENAHYMVRVLGNDPQWMAGYASPIYFDNTPRPRQPPVFKSLIKGRLYDSVSGAALPGNVSCVRFGKTEWTIPTDSQGRFQAQVPIDAQLVARDNRNREFTQDILKYEPAWSFCHYLADNYFHNMDGSVEPFRNIVREMRWEFPMGLQAAGSYVRTNLAGSAAMSNFSVVSAPPPTAGKTNCEIVMLVIDKTQVQIGDTINYAVIYRQPQGRAPAEKMMVEWKGWDTNYPRMFNKLGVNFHYNEAASALINLGGGFYLRQGSVVVPSWAGNVTDTTAAIKLFATVRSNRILEEANLMLPIGPTKRELLISSTSDGFPAAWAEIGTGPCNFFREWTFEVRYADYRKSVVRFNLNGQPITVSPMADTAHVADADNAVFTDPFYYEAQCEPQFRNIPFRDPVRPQPAQPDFSTVPIQNPPDTSAPTVVAMEPLANAQVPGGAVPFYYFIHDAGMSGAATATLLINGNAVVSGATTNPITVNLSAGTYTWQVRGYDKAGNQALSEVRTVRVGSGGTTDTTAPSVSIITPANGARVSGSGVSLTANASDNVGVAGVQFKLDGADLGAEITGAPYGVSWDTLTAANGSHSLTATARDAAGNARTSSVVAVVVSNVISSGVAWVDDNLPGGAIPLADGGDAWTWVSSNPAPFSGLRAHQSAVATDIHQHYFDNATATLPVGVGARLFAYVYLDPSHPPSEVMLQWNDGTWEHRAYWGENNISYGDNDTASRRYRGVLPPPGQWARLEVPASEVDLEGKVVKGMAFTLFGGRATWDYAGRTGSGTPADTTPPGVSITAPQHGATVSGSAVSVAATASDNVGVIGVQFKLDGVNLGVEDMSAPYTATWSTTTAANGPHTLTAVARDAAGNRTTSSAVSVTVNNPTIVNVVWVEDNLPEGAVPSADGGDAWTWITGDPAPFSGLRAHQSNVGTSAHQHYFTYATATLPVGVGDKLFAYIYLDPANPPAEVMLQWNDGSWDHRAYWGSSITTFGVEGTASRRFMGPLPPAGQWAKLEVAASQVGLEGRTLKGMAFSLYGGRATWDYAGKSGLSGGTGRRMAIQMDGGQATVTWSSEPGKIYRVLAKESLSDTNWTDVSGDIPATDVSSTWMDTTAGAARQRFYRVTE